ncbi:unnamed protein product, partial [Prorocentrum cordatum]
ARPALVEEAPEVAADGAGKVKAPAAGPPGTPSASECLLSELREHHDGALRKRSKLRAERLQFRTHLTQLEYELQAEEGIGRDLMQRIETLEAAIWRERWHREGAREEDWGARAPSTSLEA